MTDTQKSPENSAQITEKPGDKAKTPPKEIGGRGGLDPVRYGDWESNGKCVDF